MKTLLPLLLSAAIAGCTYVQSREHQTHASQQVTIGSFTLVIDTSNSYRFKSLELYPIVAGTEFIQAGSHLGPYITLKEAMDKKAIIITEMYDSVHTANSNRQDESSVVLSDASQVNTLFIENISQDTILILAGELIKGGKQDRLIAKDFLLNPKSGKTNVSVFCVEPHRWESSGVAAGVSNLAEVQVYQFDSYSKVASNKVRKSAVKEKDQRKVWNTVGYVTTQNGASSSTGSYNALEKSSSYKNEHDAYQKFFESIFESSKDIVGVIVTSGDSIIGCDIFYDPLLFRKEYGNLLDAYIIDAVTLASKSNTKTEIVTNYFTKVESDYNVPAEKPNSSKFIHNGSVIHYSSF